MPNKTIPIEFGGYNLDVQPGSLGNQALDATNIRFLPEGGITNFADSELVNAGTSGKARSPLFFWGGTLNYIVYYDTNTTSISWFAISSPATTHNLTGWTTANPFFSVLNGKLLITPPEQSNVAPVYWDGSASAVTAIATAPKASYPAVHYDRWFLGNCYNDPNIIYWSNLYGVNDAGVVTFDTATSFLYVGKDDGDKIVGLHSFNGDLYIFKKFSTWKLVGNVFSATGNYTLYKTALPGCVNHESICNIGGTMYWFSYDGFIAFNGSGIEKIGFGRVDKTCLLTGVNATPNYITIPLSNYGEIWFIHKGNTGAVPFTLVYNYLLKKWSRSTCMGSGATLVDLSSIIGNSYVKIMYNIGGIVTNAGSIYYADRASNGTNSMYMTDWIDLGDNWSTKNIFSVLINATPNGGLYDFTLGYAFNYGSYQTTDIITITANKYCKIDLKSIPARTISIYFQGYVGTNPFIINKVSLVADITDDGRLYK